MPSTHVNNLEKKTRINLRQNRKAKQRKKSGKGTFPYKVPLNFFKQNAVFSPILMSCAIVINAALRTRSSSQQ